MVIQWCIFYPSSMLNIPTDTNYLFNLVQSTVCLVTDQCFSFSFTFWSFLPTLWNYMITKGFSNLFRCISDYFRSFKFSKHKDTIYFIIWHSYEALSKICIDCKIFWLWNFPCSVLFKHKCFDWKQYGIYAFWTTYIACGFMFFVATQCWISFSIIDFSCFF